MKGTVTKILPQKRSRTEGTYWRIEFHMEDGKWAKTDVVPTYRNYKKWKGIVDRMALGSVCLGLRYRAASEVDADFLTAVMFPEVVPEKPKVKQEGLL